MPVIALNVVMAVRADGKLTPITEPRAADPVTDNLLDQPEPAAEPEPAPE